MQFKRCVHKLILRYPVSAILCILAVIYLCTVLIIAAFEQIPLGRAAMISLPAFLGELGVVESRTIVVQVAIIFSLLASIAFLAIVTAKITSIFVEFCRRGGRIMNRVKFSDHIVICGWNYQGEKIVNELVSNLKFQREIVILANCERRPLDDDRVEFISGDPCKDEDLTRAGIKKADSVIVLSDVSKGANEADAQALMIVLAVESLNRRTHTTVQLMNLANRIHLERAHADEIICLDQMGGNLVVASAMNHGVSHVVSELLTFNSGSEFYKYEGRLSGELVGKEFTDAVRVLAGKHMLLLGVETEDSPETRTALSSDVLHPITETKKVIVVNPLSPYKIKQGDALFLIAESQPANL